MQASLTYNPVTKRLFPDRIRPARVCYKMETPEVYDCMDREPPTRTECFEAIGKLDFVKNRLLHCERTAIDTVGEIQKLIERLAPPYNAEGD